MKKDKRDFLERGYFTRSTDNSQFYRWYHFNGNLMVSNNITIAFGRTLVFLLHLFIQRHAYKASFLANAICAHSVFGLVFGPMRA